LDWRKLLGLDFSDLIRIHTEDVIDEKLYFSPKKTSESGKVIIPLSDRFKEVLKRNQYVVPKPKSPSITEFNRRIRNLCNKAGMNGVIVRSKTIRGKTIKESCFRYEGVSSHTCRRTFCTLKFLKGMPAQAIMKFSGHKTERNFLKYLKLDAELNADKYKGYF
jgi:integrase